MAWLTVTRIPWKSDNDRGTVGIWGFFSLNILVRSPESLSSHGWLHIRPILDCCISVYSTTERRGLSDLHGRDEPISAACSAGRLLVCDLILSDTVYSTSSVCHSCLSSIHILTYVQIYDLIFSDHGPPVVARICYNFKVMKVTGFFLEHNPYVISD